MQKTMSERKSKMFMLVFAINLITYSTQDYSAMPAFDMFDKKTMRTNVPFKQNQQNQPQEREFKINSGEWFKDGI